MMVMEGVPNAEHIATQTPFLISIKQSNQIFINIVIINAINNIIAIITIKKTSIMKWTEIKVGEILTVRARSKSTTLVKKTCSQTNDNQGQALEKPEEQLKSKNKRTSNRNKNLDKKQ